MSEKLLDLSSRAATLDHLAGIFFFLWILCIVLFFVTIYWTEGRIEGYKNQKYEADTSEEKKKYKAKAFSWEKRQDRYLTIIFFSGVIAFLAAIGCFIATPKHYSGKVSNLSPFVQKIQTDGISLEGYYTVDYDGVDNLVTTSLFVKNNTDNWLDNAKVCETSSKKCILVENLKPGEETIVSIVTSKLNNYNFEVQDVQFSD